MNVLTAKLHHIGILVRDVAPDAVEDKAQGAFVRFQQLLGLCIELVAPNGPDSHLSGKPCGLHHLCFEVASIEGSVGAMRALGMLPISKAMPAPAFGGRLIAWFMNKDRLLIELLEET